MCIVAGHQTGGRKDLGGVDGAAQGAHTHDAAAAAQQAHPGVDHTGYPGDLDFWQPCTMSRCLCPVHCQQVHEVRSC